MSAHDAVWPARLPAKITPPATSLWMNLAISALRYPDKPALVYLGTVITYRQLLSEAEKMASALAVLGVQAGDRVVLNMQNCPQLVITHFAILRLDAVVVPVNPMNKAEELKHYITDPDTCVAVTTADLAPDLAQASNALPAQQQLKHLVVTQFSDVFEPEALTPQDLPEAWRAWLMPIRDLPVLVSGQAHAWQTLMRMDLATTLPPVKAGPDDLAVLPYTSGTTGLPKGCMHTHGTIMHNAMASGLWGNGTPENVTLCVVPMFHITGMVSVMHASIFLGASLVIMPRWDRDAAGHLISKWGVTHWTNIPTMVIDLLGSSNLQNYDLTSLTYIGGGGAAMPEAVAQRLLDQFGLRYVEGYGLTETAAPSHTNPPDAPKKQCLGIPFMSVTSRIVDPETLVELPVGESGEIVTSGPQVFKGYWKRPDATASAFFERDGLSFFRTGDMGRVDEEGYFFMTDRLKRMINASGFKVWPAEVEALMFRHPAIQEACIIATRDAYRGESVKAVVVLRQDHKGQITEQDIIDWCRENMAVYKMPRAVSFVDALPKSGSGKVMWRALQEAEMAILDPQTKA
ncbi:long-chain fatty acid--CoA ligase [Limnohabitans sp. Jir72]|uniref:long-chain fatty acid--CoA ligase n=1 Tax=Limnohabitans sp. Jir72 TaxID=1977909 RepID=UPI000D379F3C|nr:long-chain fatty acid--CoA ligase [Limnohabitans sp. Jir72]PUE31887.1 long-chain fatty acid--CoA ligase [Limnohabitans sp. Jir72]